jgi:hypothetical protein
MISAKLQVRPDGQIIRLSAIAFHKNNMFRPDQEKLRSISGVLTLVFAGVYGLCWRVNFAADKKPLPPRETANATVFCGR